MLSCYIKVQAYTLDEAMNDWGIDKFHMGSELSMCSVILKCYLLKDQLDQVHQGDLGIQENPKVQ